MDEAPCTPLPVSDDDAVSRTHPLFGENSDSDAAPETPQHASDDEAPDSGVPAGSAPPRSTAQELSSSLPVDPSKCKARTWKRAPLPLLPQCSRRSLPDHDFCAMHLQNLPYGRCDNPIDPTVLAKMAKALKRKQRKTTKRWYCRYFMFKQAQATWGLENVDDMTDEQYAQALDAVHDYLSIKANVRHAWKLTPDQGPEDATERDTPQALYAGEPRRYKNYSYRLLCFFVERKQPGATPLSCSEAVFEEALQATNERCHALFRGLPAAAHYQGPQCFSERGHAAKLVFDPSQMPSGPSRRTTYSDGSFLVLQCSNECCAKWRRVDVATYDLFWNDWMHAQREERRQTLLAREPHLCSELHVWLRESVAQYFKARPRARKPRPPFRFTLDSFQGFLNDSPLRNALYTAHQRGFLEVVLDGAASF